MFATVVASATTWYLSMNDKVDNFDNKLEAMSIAMSEWQRLEHMSLENLENKRTEFKTPWTVGNYKISVTLGEQGAFTDGQCNTTASGEEKNCFKDTTMTVYDKDGKSLYTTRTLPLSSGGDSGGKKMKIESLTLVITYDSYQEPGEYVQNFRETYVEMVYSVTDKNGNKYTWPVRQNIKGDWFIYGRWGYGWWRDPVYATKFRYNGIEYPVYPEETSRYNLLR